MIRVGTAPTGVSTKLNTFHGQTVAETGFWTNVEGVTPPPTSLSCFGSQYTSSPWLRVGGTVFVDPYGFTKTGIDVSTFYLSLTASASAKLSYSWANSYSGTLNAIIPVGSLVNVVYGEIGDLFYIRVNNKGKTYRLFVNASSSVLAVLIGPENIAKVVPGGIPFTFNLDGLDGVKGCLAFLDISGGVSNTVISKEDDLSYTKTGYGFSEQSLSGSGNSDYPSFSFWIFK